jgi:hypothetical protein
LAFGEILNLRLEDADPIFDPALVVRADTKLNADEPPRPEIDLNDFALRDEVRRLMVHLDELRNGRIHRIEIRAGIPRRITIQRHVNEAGT